MGLIAFIIYSIIAVIIGTCVHEFLDEDCDEFALFFGLLWIIAIPIGLFIMFLRKVHLLTIYMIRKIWK